MARHARGGGARGNIRTRHCSTSPDMAAAAADGRPPASWMVFFAAEQSRCSRRGGRQGGVAHAAHNEQPERAQRVSDPAAAVSAELRTLAIYSLEITCLQASRISDRLGLPDLSGSSYPIPMYPPKLACPECGSEKVHHVSTVERGLRIFACEACGTQFSETATPRPPSGR